MGFTRARVYTFTRGFVCVRVRLNTPPIWAATVEQHCFHIQGNEKSPQSRKSARKNMDNPDQSVSQLLQRWSEGDQGALDQLTPMVYDELRRMARRYMRQQPAGHTLQTTALIHEAYLRLVGQREKQWENRAHFFAVAAQAMRHILVDYARARKMAKRGGSAHQVSLDEALIIGAVGGDDLVALNDALNELAKLDRRQSQVVELRFFGGLTEEEIGEVLKVSSRTVRSDWRLARSWLLRELDREKQNDA
jgi:RNA polymerase sigma-70 factor (ECF subfamily)